MVIPKGLSNQEIAEALTVEKTKLCDYLTFRQFRPQGECLARLTIAPFHVRQRFPGFRLSLSARRTVSSAVHHRLLLVEASHARFHSLGCRETPLIYFGIFYSMFG